MLVHLAILVPSVAGLAASPPVFPSPWVCPTVESRLHAVFPAVRSFVSSLTLLEKVNLTTGSGWQSTSCVGSTGSIPRLGLPGLCLQDGPVGVRFADLVTVFPSPGTLVASWDRRVWRDQGVALATEHRDKGVDILLGPVVGPLGRVPTGGRGWEGFGPDPYLAGIAVGETVKGIQSTGVVAVVKHLVGNEQERFRRAEESGMVVSDSLSSNIPDAALREVYMWPFADAVRAGVGGVMCAYTQLNNSYSCENSFLLNGLLKGELGFEGFVVSDWQAQQSGVKAALAGMDMSMPGDSTFKSGWSFWGGNLTAAVANGTVPLWRLDDMVTRLVGALFSVGRVRWNGPNFNSWDRTTDGPDGAPNTHVDARLGHRVLARRHAARSAVLLKNKGALLPLGGTESIAVFGDDARLGATGPNGCIDRGCADGTLAIGWGSGSVDFSLLVSPEAAIMGFIADQGGSVETVTDNWAYAQVDAVAGRAGVCIVFVNAGGGEGYLTVDDNPGDRRNMTVWKNGNELVGRVADRCAKTVVVVHSTGPVVMPFARHENVSSIIWAGLPGQESGPAIVDGLFGNEPPAGKLPFTVPRSERDVGAGGISLMEPNNGGGAPQMGLDGAIDYRYYDPAGIEVEFEFGFGLTYTTFEYGDCRVSVRPGGIGQVEQTVGYTDPPASELKADRLEADALTFPAGSRRVKGHIYPYLDHSTGGSGRKSDNAWIDPAARSTGPQERNQWGGSPGGSESLWENVVNVTVRVKNVGIRPGDEVVQLYLQLGNRARVLRGFDRVSLGPGRSMDVVMRLRRRDLAVWENGWTVLDGKDVRAWVGASSRLAKEVEFNVSI